jgi:autotransporter translocation and assembly factor TamB
MRHPFFTQFILPVIVFLLAACAPAGANTTPAPQPQSPAQTAVPTSLPTATVLPEPTKALPSFTAATYKDETNGFEVDYPSDWTLVPNTVIGSRASTAQLFSPGTTAEKLLEGGTRLGITVYLWDPKSDLAAYAAHRKTAWESGGSTLLAEASGNLADGRQQISFTVQGPDKMQAFFLLTTVGENYLEIAGDGNLTLIEEIAHTLRPLNSKP